MGRHLLRRLFRVSAVMAWFGLVDEPEAEDEISPWAAGRLPWTWLVTAKLTSAFSLARTHGSLTCRVGHRLQRPRL
ncbi:hypothetical protein [Micromonospora sp. NPDC051141]|uniref:hypothetical protein n=1 Tax=Micromonospora sp. NPDC051141 TaxID=3364284 RepID=UPI0037BB1250